MRREWVEGLDDIDKKIRKGLLKLMNLYYNQCYWTTTTTMTDAPVGWNSASQEMICSICSDKAEGYHFGAISCAACGAFFRRSVSDQKVYSCTTRQCNIVHDPTKRGGSCRFCRFLKCVSSGMMPQDVRAKRNVSQQNGTSLFRTMNHSSVLIIEQIIVLRRSIAAERPGFETVSTPTTRTNLLHFLQQEFESLKRLCSRCPIFMQIIENLHSHFGINEQKDDPLRDIFLAVFVFEACFLTSAKGGVQLDRLVLPSLTHVDLNEPLFLDFLQYEPMTSMDSVRNIHNAFSFLVQMVSRSLQSSNLDESYLAILFYTVITETVPLTLRHRFVEVNRESLVADLNRVDAGSIQQFHNITGQLHQGTRAFKDILTSFA